MREEILGGLKVRLVGDSGPVVVLLHGFGAPGTDLVPLPREIRLTARYVFPEAPLLLPAELGGGVGRAWWMIDVMRLQLAMMTGQMRDLTTEEPEGLAEAHAQIRALLADVKQLFEVDELALGGFSQGAMLACDVALRSDERLTGLVLMSGSYLARDVWQPLMSKLAGLPVLMSHGQDDPLLPFVLAEQLRDDLTAAGVPVTWVPFQGGHGIAPEVLEHVGALLADIGAGSSPLAHS